MRFSFSDYLVFRASKIHDRVNHGETLQVRVYKGRILSYHYPARRGYGVHGKLIAIYRPGAQADWIADDLLSLMPLISDMSRV
jgi:hypothetical protein